MMFDLLNQSEKICRGPIFPGKKVVWIAAFGYTERALRLSERVRQLLQADQDRRNVRMIWSRERDVTAEIFSLYDVLLFFCASGIAVRKTAPFLRDKMKDPAVIVLGESGEFVIPLLSGHLGGANFYAENIASLLGTVPVITTASDGRDQPALDVWAAERKFAVSDRKLMKRIMAELLREKSGLQESSECVSFSESAGSSGSGRRSGSAYRICIASDRETALRQLEASGQNEADMLILEPKRYAVGIGCRKNCSGKEMERFVCSFLEEHGIEESLVSCLCSIDRKSGEACIKKTARSLGVPFTVYSAHELAEAEGSFSASSFVRDTVGVDNVCERSAVLGAENGILTVKKTAAPHMTAAVAVRRFPETGRFCRILTPQEWMKEASEKDRDENK